MGIFKKDEIYDYTLLQKKGYLKVKESKKSGAKVTKDGYFELGLEEMASDKSTAASSSNENPLSFFDNFSANSGTAASPLASFDAVGSSSAGQNADLKDLSVKLDDFEYKLARIADKLAMIESKILEFEERVSK